MRKIECEQRSPEWFAARIGCPTGSGFAKLIKHDGKPSTSAEAYINELIAQKLMKDIPESYENEWMIRGRELEPQAKAWYEMTTGEKITDVGFLKHDKLECGISPDGLVAVNGSIEIKCPAHNTQIKYLRKGTLPSEYKAQVMGCLWITERAWCDFLSYHPQLPSFLIRVIRDDEYIDALAKEVKKACETISREVKKLEELL